MRGLKRGGRQEVLGIMAGFLESIMDGSPRLCFRGLFNQNQIVGLAIECPEGAVEDLAIGGGVPWHAHSSGGFNRGLQEGIIEAHEGNAAAVEQGF
jgi:hypothetical protein